MWRGCFQTTEGEDGWTMMVAQSTVRPVVTDGAYNHRLVLVEDYNPARC